MLNTSISLSWLTNSQVLFVVLEGNLYTLGTDFNLLSPYCQHSQPGAWRTKATIAKLKFSTDTVRVPARAPLLSYTRRALQDQVCRYMSFSLSVNAVINY